MLINRADFQDQLELLQKCSSKSLNDDPSDKVIVIEQGLLNISRGRLITFIATPMEFSGYFLLDSLTNIIKNINGNEVNLEYGQNKKTGATELHISGSGKTTMGLAPHPMPDLSSKIEKVFEMIQDKQFKKLPDNFIDGLQKIKLCTASEKDHVILGNVSINKKILTASDNFKIGRFVMTSQIPDNFLIDTYNIDGIIAFQPTHYFLSETTISFQRNDDYQICAINRKEYPNFDPFFEKTMLDFAVEFPPEVSEAVLMSKQLPGKDPDRVLNMKMVPMKGIIFECRAPTGWYRKPVGCKWPHKAISFDLNLNVLDEILKEFTPHIEIGEPSDKKSGMGMIRKGEFYYTFPISLITE